jgi:gliding motility-associated-like protein
VLQQNTSGRFIVPNVPADITYFVRFRLGTCTSPAVPVKISVVDKSFFTIPSAFTPNGDGKNDRLSVKAIGYASLTYFRVYNRWGQLVYETTRFNNGWDGRVNGMLQETGTFVWMAEGVDILGRIGQEKGVFTLIR